MQALEGIKILDFSKWLPGQYCSMVLGDFGADIIKIESLEGDATRQFIPEVSPGMSYWHLALNRNKRGIAIDLKTAAGLKIIQQLVKEADVVIEGFRPGYLARYGLDYKGVQQINPQIIYCSITGFGQQGAFCHKPAHDLNIIGLAGLNSLDDIGTACVSEVQVSALGGSLNAISSIAMALFARERTGEGQYLDISLYNSAMSMQTVSIASLFGSEAQGTKEFGRTAHYYNIYRTLDERYLSVGTIEPKFWVRFCEVFGCPELSTRQYDFESGAEITASLANIIKTKTQAQWLQLIGDEEFCVTPVCSLSEALESDLTKSAMVISEEESEFGALKYVNPAINMSKMPGAITRRAPKLGEHTVEILENLGYSKEAITELKDLKVIALAKE